MSKVEEKIKALENSIINNARLIGDWDHERSRAKALGKYDLVTKASIRIEELMDLGRNMWYELELYKTQVHMSNNNKHTYTHRSNEDKFREYEIDEEMMELKQKISLGVR